MVAKLRRCPALDSFGGLGAGLCGRGSWVVPCLGGSLKGTHLILAHGHAGTVVELAGLVSWLCHAVADSRKGGSGCFGAPTDCTHMHLG